MKTSRMSLIGVLVIGAAAWAASGANAGGFSFGVGGGGGGGGNKGSFKINFSGPNNSHHKHDDYHHDHHRHVCYYTPPVRIFYSQCYHPQFCCCYVFPGDTWYSISKRLYGVEFLCKHIASYNGLSMYSPLVPGQMLRLPVVNSNGSLGVSNAPMPAPFAPQDVPFAAATAQPGLQGSMIAPQGPSIGMSVASASPQGPSIAPLSANVATTSAGATATVTPAATIRTVQEERELPRVAIGSTLMLDGESLGVAKGTVRLRLGALTLPVGVSEWTTSSVKIELPKLELGSPVKASLEVLRADGTVGNRADARRHSPGPG